MKLKPGQSAAESVRALLPRMARKYFEAGREAIQGKRSPVELHRFRIATKKFRYSLELFRPLYGPKLDRYLKALRALQGTLGKLSDYQSIQAVLDGNPILRAKLQRATKRKLKDLRRLWRTFDQDGELKRWKSYLGREQSAGVRKTRTAPARKPATRPTR